VIPWWLRLTKDGRFYAYHRNCRLRTSRVLGNSFGYFYYVECEENGLHSDHSWGHMHERLYSATGYPFTPPW
jgi:hypothetical protein